MRGKLERMNKGDGGGEREKKMAACGIGKGTIRKKFPRSLPHKKSRKNRVMSQGANAGSTVRRPSHGAIAWRGCADSACIGGIETESHLKFRRGGGQEGEEGWGEEANVQRFLREIFGCAWCPPCLSPPEMALTEKLDLNTKQDPRSRRRKGGGPSGLLENKHDARRKRKKKKNITQTRHLYGHGGLLSHRARCA
ncbi:hypothetical protein Naga_101527g2 [Nannochloropsis gaditana]|uniref:Uncharacterized protein n=1 Tax=Nannochloropsis gaditana TaxID=72520 RepID=W7TDS0_9STRA|nr:hypothetical protein Naga_101527g2 [Nannochloropsis gaditana]